MNIFACEMIPPLKPRVQTSFSSIPRIRIVGLFRDLFSRGHDASQPQ